MTFWKGDLPYATVCFWSTPLNYIVIWPLKCTQDALFKFQGNYEKTDQTTRIPMLVSVPLLYRDETAAAHSNYDRPQMMLMLRDGYFPFKLIWLQLKCVLQPWTGLADVSCTYAASSDPPTCTWRAWTVKESVKILLLLGFITYKTNQLILRCHRADFSLVERNGLYSEKKKVGGSHALLQHSDSLAAEHRQMWLIKQSCIRGKSSYPWNWNSCKWAGFLVRRQKCGHV